MNACKCSDTPVVDFTGLCCGLNRNVLFEVEECLLTVSMFAQGILHQTDHLPDDFCQINVKKNLSSE